jgi:hypothetical protein
LRLRSSEFVHTTLNAGNALRNVGPFDPLFLNSHSAKQYVDSGVFRATRGAAREIITIPFSSLYQFVYVEQPPARTIETAWWLTRKESTSCEASPEAVHAVANFIGDLAKVDVRIRATDFHANAVGC